MSQRTAAAIEHNVHSIANRAWHRLSTHHEQLERRFGSDAEALWHDHLAQRLNELSAAIAVEDCQLFASKLAWSRSAALARGLTTDELDQSLMALHDAIADELTGELEDTDVSAAQHYVNKAIGIISKSATTVGKPLDAGSPLNQLALQYIQAVVAGNVLQGMQIVADEVEHGLSISDALLKVLLPAQTEVGRLWHINALSVSEEHLVSYTTQRLMATLVTTAVHKPDNGYTAVAGAVSGNVHDIGIRAITYLMELEGWRTIYLGSDIPRNELPGALDGFEADVLLLSVALTSQLAETTKTIADIRSNCPRPVKVLVGGNGLSESTELWQQIGADGYTTDANSALQLALEMARSS